MNLDNFDPDAPGITNGSYFGLPFTPDEAGLVLLSVPWDVTVSYGEGTAEAPESMIKASLQIDLFDLHNPEGWKKGIATIPLDTRVARLGNQLREKAREVIESYEEGREESHETREMIAEINKGSQWLNRYVYDQSVKYLAGNRRVAVVGGDHSVPLGLIRALGQRHENFGILHIDAHADLREAYEGFTYSHASIMYNVLNEVPSVSRLVQVGVRDLGKKEYDLAVENPKVAQFDDYMIGGALLGGRSWDSVCDSIISELPEKVYVSFDIDGLSPENCPGTGTPVPGGLSFRESVYMIDKVRESGREIIGFDLCEVAPASDENEFEANIGARILYKLCNLTLK